ncbi:GNAT family N-acetyltransferase [Paenibacillus sp. NPDC058071]|uniref:GNAT family N-acetyltransferase n=1 Tax=Paenibacillus sp. NPDC058071 TaxID=3346326 RepID=UPI0036DF60D9
MPLLGELYQAVTATENAIFWWVGEENNWPNVYCAFENNRMIAKGQVSVINVVPPGRSPDSKHAIYVNLKTVPERETDENLLERLYQPLLARATELKEDLSKEYDTILCVGNDSKEIANNRFFVSKGYAPLKSLFLMKQQLDKPIENRLLPESFRTSFWGMETPEEQQQYLKIESEIWPDTPLGLNRLEEYRQHELWTSIIVHEANEIVAGLLVWKEENDGFIEDVFVREPWRKRGLAKHLLVQALLYLRSHDLSNAKLMVETANHSALSLYESVGFAIDKQEMRYYIPLK